MYLIVGASVRPMVQSAVEAGIPVVAADFFADWDTHQSPGQRDETRGRCVHQIRDFSVATKFLDQGETTGLIYGGGLENHPELLAHWSLQTIVLGCSADSVKRVRDPFLLCAELERAGYLFPESSMVPPHDDGNHWLVKRHDSAGGQRIHPLGEAPRGLSPSSTKIYYQKRVTGTSLGCAFFAEGNAAELFGTCRLTHRRTADSHFGYNGAIGPISLTRNTRAQIEAIGNCVAQQFRLVGWFGIDVIIGADGVFVLEVNPRFTASMEIHERLIGRSLVACHLDCLQRGQLPGLPQPAGAEYIGKRIVYQAATAPLRVTADCFEEMRVWHAEGRASDIPMPGSKISSGHPVLTLWATDNTIADTAQQLDEFEQFWTHRLESYRQGPPTKASVVD